MIKKIKIKDEETLKRLHFKTASFEKVNVLFGGNGSGKSTLLKYLEKGLKENSKDIEKDPNSKYIVHTYYNGKDNERHNNPSPMDSKNYAPKLAKRMHALYLSEGQSIVYSFSGWLNDFLNSYTKEDQHIIIFDEIDSGLSCDHVNVILHMFHDEVFNKDNIQVFIASNMYHWVHALKKVFSLYEGKSIEINSYEEYFRTQQDMQREVGAKSDFNFL
jgi:energy-coupling factor transporter ATP-binding protein EcfA2